MERRRDVGVAPRPLIVRRPSPRCTDFLEDKVLVKPDGGVIVDEDMATNVPGVFAIGDICNRPHKQAVNAASDGCIAAMSVEKYLKGRKTVRVDWYHK